MLRIKV